MIELLPNVLIIYYCLIQVEQYMSIALLLSQDTYNKMIFRFFSLSTCN